MDRYGHLFKSDDHKETMDMIAAALLLAYILPILLSDRYFGDQQITFADNHSNFCTLTQ